MTRAWGLEVDRVELAVEAVLQPPQDSPTGPSLDSTLQQLALHFLGGGLSSVAGGAPLLGTGEEPQGKVGVLTRVLSLVSGTGYLFPSLSTSGSAHPAQLFRPPQFWS